MAYIAYRFRLRPNKTQTVELGHQLETLRRVYNDALQLRKDVYTLTGKSPPTGYLYRVIVLSRNAQLQELKENEKGPKWLTRVSATAVRDVCARVETAFDNFFRRLKEGKTGRAVGFPRFKSYGRLTSIPFENTYPAGCVIRTADGSIAGTSFNRPVVKPRKSPAADTGADKKPSGGKKCVRDIPLGRTGYRLDVFGVGSIRIVVHRPVTGVVKTACVERDVDGKWYAVLVAEQDAKPVPTKVGPAVGIDVGLSHFLTTSDGRHESNPRYLKAALKELRRRQQRASRQIETAKKAKAKFRDCKDLQKSFRAVAKVHVRVRNQRKDNHHKVANRLVDECGTVCVERLDVQGMKRNNKRSRSISDAAWGAFLIVLKHKAEKAGVRFVEVDPAGTSQTCPECGAVAKKTLFQRRHVCPCGYETDRDHAAARVILARGIGPTGSGPDPGDVNGAGTPGGKPPGGRRGRKRPPIESFRSPVDESRAGTNKATLERSKKGTRSRGRPEEKSG